MSNWDAEGNLKFTADSIDLPVGRFQDFTPGREVGSDWNAGHDRPRNPVLPQSATLPYPAPSLFDVRRHLSALGQRLMGVGADSIPDRARTQIYMNDPNRARILTGPLQLEDSAAPRLTAQERYQLDWALFSLRHAVGR